MLIHACRTGRCFALSSRSSSKFLPSAFTPLSFTASTPSADSPNPWICVTKLALIFILLSSEVNLHPIPPASRRLPWPLHFLRIFTMTQSMQQRMVNVTTSRPSLLRNTSRSLNRSHSIYSRLQSRFILPLLLCRRMGLSQRLRSRSMSQQRLGSRHTMQYPYQERTQAHSQVQDTNHRA